MSATSSTKKKRDTRADLQRKVMELEAQLASTYYFASATLHKAGEDLMASGALVQIHALGGRPLICPVVIRDGLSDDTIEALQRDIARSYEAAVAFKPKGVKK